MIRRLAMIPAVAIVLGVSPGMAAAQLVPPTDPVDGVPTADCANPQGEVCDPRVWNPQVDPKDPPKPDPGYVGRVQTWSTATAATALLTAQEAETAAGIFVGVPGSATTWLVLPDGCTNTDPSCAFTVSTELPPDASTTQAGETDSPAAVALNGASIRLLENRPIADSPLAATGDTAAALATPTIRYWTIYDDHLCSVVGCGPWEFQLNSKAYCDGKYAWGSRSRYGYAGWATKDGTHTAGYSISSSAGFSGDPSRVDLYAYNDGKLSAAFKGFPMSWNKFVHRHYLGSCGRAWLVAG